MLYVNLFPNEGALLETEPQGDASALVILPPADAELLAQLLDCPEASAALAAALALPFAGAGWWLANSRAVSTTVSFCELSCTLISSPTLTWNEGMFTLRPFTSTCP